MRIELKNTPPAAPVHMVWGPIAILFIAAAGIFRGIAPHLPNCVFHEITGFPCPTCGGTRSLIALSQFDFFSSFLYNPLALLFTIGLIVFSLLFLVGIISNKSLKIMLSERGKKVLRYSAISLFIFNWIFLILTGH